MRKDVSAFRCLGLCSEDLWSNIGDLDVAHGERCSGVKGLGICVLSRPLTSPGNLGKSLTSAPWCPHW